MKRINPPAAFFLMVVSVLAALSLACNFGGIIPRPPTPTAVVRPTKVPTMAPEATTTPEDLTPSETPTADKGVTDSSIQDGLITDMVKAPALAKSNADNVLKKDVIKAIVDNTYQEGCTYNFTRVYVPNLPKNLQSEWVEEWTMDICGKNTTLLVTFTPDPNGGTNFAVKAKK